MTSEGWERYQAADVIFKPEGPGAEARSAVEAPDALGALRRFGYKAMWQPPRTTFSAR